MNENEQTEYLSAALTVIREGEFPAIESENEDSEALDALRLVRRKIKDIEAERMNLTRPLDEAKKKIKAKWDVPIKRLNGYAAIIIAARRKWETRKAELERKRQAEAEEQAAQLEEQGMGEVAEAVRTAAAPVEEKVKGKGISYSAKVVDLPALIRAVAEGRADLNFLQDNPVAINAEARRSKQDFAVPGCELIEKEYYR